MRKGKKQIPAEKSGEKKSILLFFALAVSVLALDRLAKNYLLSKFSFNDFLPLLGKTVYMHLVQNTGAAFGMFRDLNAALVWISIAFLGAILILFGQILKSPYSRWMSAFSGMLFGGILGNLVDRIFYGYVIDFIDFRFFAVFNIADSFITIGAIGIAALIFFAKEKKCNKSGKRMNNRKRSRKK
jgi:signal peptidase II